MGGSMMVMMVFCLSVVQRDGRTSETRDVVVERNETVVEKLQLKGQPDQQMPYHSLTIPLRRLSQTSSGQQPLCR